jgi:hypothetical protein
MSPSLVTRTRCVNSAFQLLTAARQPAAGDATV